MALAALKTKCFSEEDVVARPLAHFPPDVWGQDFVNFTHDDILAMEEYEQKLVVLKEKVRIMLMDDNIDLAKKISLIDDVERLGVGYLYENEITEMLNQIFEEVSRVNFSIDYDLHTTASLFRILRQHGHKIPSDVFKKFTNSEGKIKERLKSDIKGIVSLYEASHLRTHGEPILDEAITLTTEILTLASSESEQARHALKQVFHFRIQRLESRYFVSCYETYESRNETLLQLAKMDFDRLQLLHRQELAQLLKYQADPSEERSRNKLQQVWNLLLENCNFRAEGAVEEPVVRPGFYMTNSNKRNKKNANEHRDLIWWHKFDFTTKLPYARQRCVECHFWTVCMYPEPQFSVARMLLVKGILVISILDDTYDAYGTFEELQQLTDAFERWDLSDVKHFPKEYMKLVFEFVYNIYEDMAKEMTAKGRSYAAQSAKSSAMDLIRSYFTEAKWMNEKHIPTFEEYMVAAKITGCAQMLTMSSMVGMEDLDEKSFEKIRQAPKAIKACEVISRLMDDIVSHEEEQTRDHVASGVECYMKEYNKSREETVKVFNEMFEDAWKDLNEELLDCCSYNQTIGDKLPKLVLNRILHLSRVLDSLYKVIDGYTYSAKLIKEDIIDTYKRSFDSILI